MARKGVRLAFETSISHLFRSDRRGIQGMSWNRSALVVACQCWRMTQPRRSAKRHSASTHPLSRYFDEPSGLCCIQTPWLGLGKPGSNHKVTVKYRGIKGKASTYHMCAITVRCFPHGSNHISVRRKRRVSCIKA